MIALSVTACSPPHGQPPETSQPHSSASPTSTPPLPSGAPSATQADAEAALTSFAAVTARIWESDARGQGRAYIDALTQAGFAKDEMQVTADRSTVGNPAESLLFSVAWSDTQCLVGQVGPSTGEPVTAVMPRLSDGACLAGTTRPIDW